MLNSYVINLKKRKDRLDRFMLLWNSEFSKFPLTVIEAITPDTISKSPYISEDTSEYFNNIAIRATIESHVNTWTIIANSESMGGLVFEDDVLLSHYFKSFENYLTELKKLDKNSIVYLGTGDFLPIHTKPPSDSMLRAQEKVHAIPIIGLKYFGRINMKSSYVFDWLGAFSYFISKDTAKFLLELAKNKPINKAVDVWLKENVESKYVTIPLMMWHPSISADNYDSDITPRNC
jgi:GR25 family glycosyltransferase involved in LPS biosynthesis